MTGFVLWVQISCTRDWPARHESTWLHLLTILQLIQVQPQLEVPSHCLAVSGEPGKDLKVCGHILGLDLKHLSSVMDTQVFLIEH